MYEYLKGVLEYGFANRCEGATVLGMEMNHLSCQMVFPLCWNRKGARVHGMEMNHISNNYSGTFEGGPRRWFGYCVCVGGDGYIFRSVYSLLHTSWYHVSNLNDCLGDMSLS